jgi:hypothetical protein
MGDRDGLIYDPQTINWDARRRVEELTMDPNKDDDSPVGVKPEKGTSVSLLITVAGVLAVIGIATLSIVRAFS